MAYGLPIEGEGDSKCLALLNTVEEVVSRQLRGCKGGLSTKKKGCEGRKTFRWTSYFTPILMLTELESCVCVFHLV